LVKVYPIGVGGLAGQGTLKAFAEEVAQDLQVPKGHKVDLCFYSSKNGAYSNQPHYMRSLWRGSSELATIQAESLRLASLTHMLFLGVLTGFNDRHESGLSLDTLLGELREIVVIVTPDSV